jgi:DNA-binding transcriptional LysR family regulator
MDMRSIQSFDCSILQMRMFLAIAEEKSFSRAAERMHMEQPTLSRRISLLEQAFEVSLFKRGTRPIQLTDEGKILYDHWKSLLAQFENSLYLVMSLEKQYSNRLAVCCVDSTNFFNDIPALSRRMHEKIPELTITFEYLSFSQWRPKLLNNQFDIVLTIRFETDSLDDRFEYSEIFTIPKLVCMLNSNPLSKKRKITYDDLKNQSFVVIDENESPDYVNYLRNICRENGFEPKIGKRVSNAHGLISGIQEDNEVVVCDEFLRGFNNSLLKAFELPDTYSGACGVWLKGSRNPYIKSFLDTLRQFYDFTTKSLLCEGMTCLNG